MRAIHILFIVIFVGLLWAPLVKSLSGQGEANLVEENRKLHPAPVLRPSVESVAVFPRNFDDYYQDVFGFRDSLIKKNQRLKMQMGVLISERAIQGKDGWYFYAGDDAVNDYRGLLPYNMLQLERFRIALEQKQAWLRKQGVAYVFALTPNKHSLYPEYMSDKYPKIGKQTRADQIAEYLEGRTEANFLDLRPPLLEAKKAERIYHKVDTHWNDVGAYIGYSEIINNLRRFFPSLEPTPRGQFEQYRQMGKSGDLGLLMGKRDEILEEYINMRPKFTRCARRVPYSIESVKGQPNAEHTVFATVCEEKELVALVFRDSFTVLLQPFLSENFHKVIYINKPYNHADAVEVIAREKPDVVIEQSVERHVEVTDELAVYTAARYADTFFESAQPLVVVDKPAGLISHEGMEIRQSETGIELMTDSQQSNLVVFSGKGQRLKMRILLDAPADTFLRLRYNVRMPDAGLREDVRDISIVEGRNNVYVDMSAFPVEGDIRLSPGIVPGAYHIEAIELRGML